MEKLNASVASTSHNIASAAPHNAAINLAGTATNSIGVQNVQVRTVYRIQNLGFCCADFR